MFIFLTNSVANAFLILVVFVMHDRGLQNEMPPSPLRSKLHPLNHYHCLESSFEFSMYYSYANRDDMIMLFNNANRDDIIVLGLRL